jgi:hypothetical protein
MFKLNPRQEKIFSSNELEHIEQLNNAYRNNLKQHSQTIIRKEFERLTKELVALLAMPYCWLIITALSPTEALMRLNIKKR